MVRLRRPDAAARHKRQRGAPRQPNDVDTDKRRRTIADLPDRLMTPSFIHRREPDADVHRMLKLSAQTLCMPGRTPLRLRCLAV